MGRIGKAEIYKEVSNGAGMNSIIKYSRTLTGAAVRDYVTTNASGIMNVVNEIVYDSALVGSHHTVIEQSLKNIDPIIMYDIYTDTNTDNKMIYIENCSRLSDEDVKTIYNLQVERIGEYSGKDITKCIANCTLESYDMSSGYSFYPETIQSSSKYAVYTRDDNKDSFYVFKINDPKNNIGMYDLTKYGLCTGADILNIKEKQQSSSTIYYLVRFKENDKDDKGFAVCEIKEGDIDPDEIYYTYLRFYGHDLYIENRTDEKKSDDTLSYIKNGEVYTGAQLRKYSTDNKDTDINAFYLYQSFFKEHNLSRLDVDDDKEYRLLIKTNHGSYVSLIDIEEENRIKKYDNPDHEVTIFGKYYIPFDTKESYKFSEILSWLDYCKAKYENAEEGEDKSKYFLGYLAYKKYESKLNNFKPNQYCYLEFYNIEKIYSDIQTPISLEDLVMLVKDSKKEAEDIQEEENGDHPKTITYTDDKISEYVSKLGLDNDFKETLNGFMDYLQNGNS